MRFLILVFCILSANLVDAVSAASAGDRNLRGRVAARATHARLGIEAPFGPDPGPVGKKPAPVQSAENIQREWFVPFASLKNIALTTWMQLIVTSVVWMSLVVLTACAYRNSSGYNPKIGPKSNDPAGTRTSLADWQSQWYQCHLYPGTLAWSCCCPCIRWAHNMDLLQFLDYWPAFLVFFLLESLNQLTGFLFVGIFFTMLLVFYRQKTRKLFGLPNYGTLTGYTIDWCGLCFCWPCLIAQEAHHISEAAKEGWTKDLAVKTGLFSATPTPREPTDVPNPSDVQIHRFLIPNRPAGLPLASPSDSPSGSAYQTPRM